MSCHRHVAVELRPWWGWGGLSYLTRSRIDQAAYRKHVLLCNLEKISTCLVYFVILKMFLEVTKEI